jgi:uncharacterized protein (TIGR02145 family)
MCKLKIYPLLLLLLLCFSSVLAGTVADIDGNVYQTVTVGTQVWMAENLKVTHYRNGDAIPNGVALLIGAYCEYNDDINNVETYGRLYNWYAVSDSRNIAPVGWHVPSNAEWQTLVNFLGGEAVAGGKIKETGTTHWISPNTGATNESGLTALPGGYASYSGDYFGEMGSTALFWSSSEYEYDSYAAWYQAANYTSSYLYSDYFNKQDGYSIRCVRDIASTTIFVPADQPTIQAAIDIAADYDTIMVSSGIYCGNGNINIHLNGKWIYLISEKGPDSTVIDCQGDYDNRQRGLIADIDLNYDGEISPFIKGFTFINGYAPNDPIYGPAGGAIFCTNGAGATIRNCIFKNNGYSAIAVTGYDGYSILDVDGCVFDSCSISILGNCRLRNSVVRYGGFMSTFPAGLEAYNCRFENVSGVLFKINRDPFNSYGMLYPGIMLENCVMINIGSFADVSGYNYDWQTGIDIGDCTIINAGDITGLYATLGIQRSILAYCGFGLSDFDGNIFINCTDNYGNGWMGRLSPYLGINGNISLNPIFCDTNSGIYSIYNSSPCAPANNSCGVLIGALGIGCEFQGVTIHMENDTSFGHISSHIPLISWDYKEANGYPQTEFEIAVGIDTNWTYAEMWNPAPVASSDTFVTYAGASLIDGQTYYLRLRVHNGTVWSNWFYTSFRMNTPPTVPATLTPLDSAVENTLQPTLQIAKSTDPEDGDLFYDFEVKSISGHIVASEMEVPGSGETISWQIPVALFEDAIYWWRVRSTDRYEYGEWSEYEPFWINATEEPPFAFNIAKLPDSTRNMVFNMLPTFNWDESLDPDPRDSVHYTFYLSTDSNFLFILTKDSLTQNLYSAVDSLHFATKYWWKVKATDSKGNFTNSNNILSFRTWKLGDANGDWGVNLLDVSFIINALYRGGAQPSPKAAADFNGDCKVNLLDVSYLINSLYRSGPDPMIGCE